MPNPNTQHWPTGCADDLYRDRMSTSTVRRLPEVPAEWQDRFTPAEWDAYLRERFDCYHSFAAILSPEAYLNGARYRNV